MTIGEQIKEKRELKNLSQEDLAAQLNVSRQAVSKWENDISVPHGINKEMLTQVLEMEFTEEDREKPALNKKAWIYIGIGWLAAAVLSVVIIILCTSGGDIDTTKETTVDITEPYIKNVTFYDENQEIVEEDALWYNSAKIDSVLVEWEGGMPDSIKVFATPAGSETLEETELLLTKSVREAGSAVLLNADSLKDGYMIHVYFELDFGPNIVISDLYNVIYDEEGL